MNLPVMYAASWTGPISARQRAVLSYFPATARLMTIAQFVRMQTSRTGRGTRYRSKTETGRAGTQMVQTSVALTVRFDLGDRWSSDPSDCAGSMRLPSSGTFSDGPGPLRRRHASPLGGSQTPPSTR